LWIAKYPVTLAQITAFRRAAILTDVPLRSVAENVPPSMPATVTWHEAVAFCDWANRVARNGPGLPADVPTQYVVRLPTEAEWTRAAGASRYPWGDDFDGRRANTSSSRLGEPIAVGMYPSGDTAAGVSDLAGNVWEWCADTGSDRADGVEPYVLRVIKGGSAFEPPQRCVVAATRSMRGDVVRPDRGFRICCGPAGPRRGFR
jgi:formylglycine-generating enzyme required for sulfatase activity